MNPQGNALMTEKWKVVDAFAHFDGAECTNIVWSWSARSSNDGTVVVALWKDQIECDDTSVVVDFFNHKRLRDWIKKLGNKERIENLVWARDHCGGLFKIVMLEARDTNAPRRIAKVRYPHPTLVMKLVDLNEQTGEFRAESVQT
jgi:hypothetical protein